MSMAGRLILSALLAGSILASGNLYAQGYGPPPAANYPSFAENPAFYYGQGPAPNLPYYGPDGIVTTGRVYSNEELYEPSPFEAVLTRVVKHSWYRLEYMLWDLEDPGSVLLGAPLADIPDPTQPFAVVEPGTLNPLGVARVLTTEDISLTDVNGMRATIGVPLSFGALEVRGFAMEQGGDKLNAPELPSLFFVDIFQDGFFFNTEQANFVATSTFTDGAPGDNLFLYDTAFDASFRSDLWGTEALFVIDTGHFHDKGVRISPMVGASFLRIQEDLTQVGVFTDLLNGGTENLVSLINSDTVNNIYGATFGIRAELVHKWFTVGAEPKITVGLDTLQARVNTERLRSNADPRVTTMEKDTIFSPVGELGLFARANINENFSIHFAYTWLWAFRISRPQENIFYNDNGLLNPPAVVLDREIDDYIANGWSVGGEIRFGKN